MLNLRISVKKQEVILDNNDKSQTKLSVSQSCEGGGDL